MSEDMRRLEVPSESRDVIRDAQPDFLDHDEEANAYVLDIARPVVAAELDRIADAWAEMYDEEPSEAADLIRDLRGRAAVLRG